MAQPQFAGSDTIHVILGRMRYRMLPAWPNGQQRLAGLSDVTALPDGRIVALRRVAPQLLFFSTDGDLLDEVIVPGLVGGHYLSTRPDGGMLLADYDGHCIFRLDNAGRVQGVIGEAGRPNWLAPFNHPTSAVQAEDGGMFVADGYGNSNLHGFASDGQLQFTVGKPGHDRDAFSTPHCVVLSDDGRLFVSDRENNRIQVFDRQGRHQYQIGLVYKPMALALTPQGQLLVTDQTPRLSLFTLDGELLGRCRTLGVYGHGLTCAQDGRIVVAGMAPDELCCLQPL